MQIVFVIGIPSSGYEQVAVTATQEMGWQAIHLAAQAAKNLDTDLEVLHLYRGVEEITAAYHDCFTALIDSILAGKIFQALVILPADLFDNPKNLALIKTLDDRLGGLRGVIFDLNIQNLSQRIGLNQPRAVGLGAPRAILRQLIEEKRQLWAQLGFSRLDANTADIDSLVTYLKRFITNNSDDDFD